MRFPHETERKRCSSGETSGGGGDRSPDVSNVPRRRNGKTGAGKTAKGTKKNEE